MSALHGVPLAPIREYLASLGYPIDPARLIERPEQRLSTLCYLSVDGRLLMLKRRKEPFAQHWTAPGGKIQPGEDPREAILREMREETHLTVHHPQLRAVCSEVGGPEYSWLLFIFSCASYSGRLGTTDEGELRWLDLNRLSAWPLPDIDRHILGYVLEPSPTPWFIRVEYSPDHQVTTFQARSLEAMLD